MQEMYKGVANSPETELTESVSAQATIIKVNNINAFPDGPNLATIGTDENAETIKYATKTSNALSGCQRGVEGTARVWQSGEKVARNFTNKDHADLIENIKELEQEKLNKTATAADSEKLGGKPAGDYAAAAQLLSAQTQIAQLQSDLAAVNQQLNNKVGKAFEWTDKDTQVIRWASRNVEIPQLILNQGFPPPLMIFHALVQGEYAPLNRIANKRITNISNWEDVSLTTGRIYTMYWDDGQDRFFVQI